MTKRRPKRHARRAIGWWAVLAVGLALGSALACLAAIGEPPVLRIDPLWVNDHIEHVRLLVASLVVAVAVSAAALLVKRNRLVVLGLWTVAAVATFWQFWAQAVIVAKVVAGEV